MTIFCIFLQGIDLFFGRQRSQIDAIMALLPVFQVREEPEKESCLF